MLPQFENILKSSFIKYMEGSDDPESLVDPMLESWRWWLDSFLVDYQQNPSNLSLITRDFADSEGLSIRASCADFCVAPGHLDNKAFADIPDDDRLIGCILNPFGIKYDFERTFEKQGYDEGIASFNNQLLFLLNQYIYRSYYINFIGAVDVVYGQSLSFMGRCSSTRRVDKQYRLPKVESVTTSEKKVSSLLGTINSLDPHINRAVFYLNAALAYHDNDYSLCITPLENTVTVISDLVLNRISSREASHPLRVEMAAHNLGVSDHDLDILKDLYDLRNHQTSHPSIYQWWDLDEYVGDLMEEAFSVVTNMFCKACTFEQGHRLFEKDIGSWSAWVSTHGAELLKYLWGNYPKFRTQVESSAEDE
jgi:hypothetical protein